MEKIVLAADLGGTNLRLAAVAGDGTLLHRSRIATPVSRLSGDIVSAIVKLAAELVEKMGPERRPLAFGVAVPAIIDSKAGKVLSAPNLPDLDGADLAGMLYKQLRLRVLLENDANAAAVGENWLGASQSFGSSICVMLGTGVGGGLIFDGRLMRGVDGTAGEIGHITVEPDGFACGCGSRGCVEQYSSGSAIIRFAKTLASQFPDSRLHGLADVSPADVFDAGLRGDPMALEIFRLSGKYLGIALAGLVNVLNPEVIVIGGGVSASWDLFIGHTRDEIRARTFDTPGGRVKLVRAELGDDGGILGAARLAFQSEKIV